MGEVFRGVDVDEEPLEDDRDGLRWDHVTTMNEGIPAYRVAVTVEPMRLWRVLATLVRHLTRNDGRNRSLLGDPQLFVSRVVMGDGTDRDGRVRLVTDKSSNREIDFCCRTQWARRLEKYGDIEHGIERVLSLTPSMSPRVGRRRCVVCQFGGPHDGEIGTISHCFLGHLIIVGGDHDMGHRVRADAALTRMRDESSPSHAAKVLPRNTLASGPRRHNGQHVCVPIIRHPEACQ